MHHRNPADSPYHVEPDGPRRRRGPFRLCRHPWIGFLAACTLSWPAAWWPAAVSAQRLHVDLYGIQDGLPSPRVRAISQGPDGRLWIAGPAGVAAYDGSHWKDYGLSAGLRWGDQTALLWHDDDLYSISHQPPFPPSRWQPGSAGGAWQPVDGPDIPSDAVLYDVAIFAPRGPRPSEDAGSLVYATSEGLFFQTARGWIRLTTADGLPSDRVYSLANWRGQLVLATANGLGVADGPRVRALERRLEDGSDTLPSEPIYALAPARDARDTLWLVADGWIGQLTESGVRRLDPASRFRPQAGPVRAAADGLGGLYVSGVEATAPWVDARTRGTGVLYVHPTLGTQALGPAQGLSTGTVSDLFVDREANVWFGGERGLAKIVSRQFAVWDQRVGLLDDEVFSALQRSDGSLVLGHRGGLSVLRQDGARIVVDTRSLPLSSPDQRRIEPVRDLAEDGAGVLWLAAESAGVLALPTLVSEPRRYDSAAGLEGDATALVVNDDDVWVGTDRGVFVGDARGGRAGFRRVAGSGSGIETLHVRQMEPDGDGVMVASSSGVHRVSRTFHRSWSCGESACDSTFGLLPTSDGEWWVGTADGVYELSSESGSTDMRRVDETPFEALRRPVFFLVEQAGWFWLGTDDGVVRATRGDTIWQHLSVEDGLSGRETHRASALLDDQGRVWFGTDGGTTVYDGRLDRGARQPPLVRLTSIMAGGEPYDPRRPLRLAYDDNDLVFRFQAVSLIDEDRVLVRRMLEGEEDWSQPFQSDGELRYSNLAPGTYRLHLEAAGATGVWSSTELSAPIVVRAPFWSTPWFVVLGALVLALATWGLVVLVSQRRYYQRLRLEVAERTAELQASEDRYRKTFKAIDDGVVATDAEGRVQLLNPTAQRLTGWTETEARGRSVDEVFTIYPPQDSVLEVTEGTEPISLLGGELDESIGPTRPALLEARDGRRRHIDLSMSPIASRDQGVTGLVFAFRDVTRRRRIEEELSRTQKLEAVGILAGGIAHDFNNLLTVLLGNLSLIHESTRLDPDTAKFLADSETALMRARDLTQQLLTFSRGGAPVRETASASEVLRDSTSFVLRGSKVRHEFDLATGLWMVDIDAGQISQVLQNLLINADQAMPGGGTVRIRAANVSEAPSPLPAGRYVRIDVVDEGVGIPKDLQMRIFDPYFSTKQEGRGLGLASAYAIVKKHEGLLTVRSRIGGGTTFSIFLPASSKGLREPALREPSGPLPAGGLPGFTGRRILLMDDDRVVRRTAGAMLSRLGCEVEHAEHGARALALYERALDDGRPFDAVLMDLTVPGGMGGQEAVRRLRALDPDAVAIVYSGYSTDPVLAEYADYGFDGRLSKPFRIRELAAVLEEVFAARRTCDAPRIDAREVIP